MLIAAGLLLTPLAIVAMQVVVWLVSRTMSQREECARIVPVIADSRKAFADSLVRSGKTRVTVLLENYKDPEIPGIEADHGISLFVERNGRSYVFDLGESGISVTNAASLGVDVAKVDAVFVSHGHIDHGGGLPAFLAKNTKAPVFLSVHAPEKHYRRLSFLKFDTSLAKNDPDLFTRFGDRFRFLSQDAMPVEDIFAVTEIQGSSKRPSANEGVLAKGADGSVAADDFAHEVAYVIRDDDGLIVYSGCNHNGLLNTLETVTKRFPGMRVKAVLGGFHLMNPITNRMEESESDVRAIAVELQTRYPGIKIYTGHCTGVEGYTILKSCLGESIEYFTTGSVFCIDWLFPDSVP